jgi:hypothetical protein
VPGFSGWGAPLLGSLNYWGGVQDIPHLLMKKGHTVIVSSIAPLSSNWERACELYKELTCGRYVESQQASTRISIIMNTDLSPIMPTMRKYSIATTWTSTMDTTSKGIQAIAPRTKVRRKQEPRTGSVRSYSRSIRGNTWIGNGPEKTRSTLSAILREELPSDYLSISWQIATRDIKSTLVNVEEIPGLSL